MNSSFLYHLELDTIHNPNDFYSDISWDAVHEKFIASGFARNTSLGLKDPFVQVFELSNFTTIIPVAEYCVLNHFYTQSNEYKTLHVQLDDNNLILYYDLRYITDSTTHDIIWLSRIKNFWDLNTLNIDESWFYKLPGAKLSSKDMIYDPYNSRLNFLGYVNHCKNGLSHILAQVDPYTLSSGIKIGQLGAMFMGDTCHNYQIPFIDFYYNSLNLSNLMLNTKNPCHPVLIAGVCDEGSILTETYDIFLSKCDTDMWHKDMIANPTMKPYSFVFSYSLDTFHLAIANGIQENVMVNILCNEPDACSHQVSGKVLQLFLTNDSMLARIIMESNYQFVCEGFEGKIQFFLYDIAGKLLQRGITYNGEQNLLRISNGIYLLKAMDASGSHVLKKIVVL